jgi:hypothetical protein
VATLWYEKYQVVNMTFPTEEKFQNTFISFEAYSVDEDSDEEGLFNDNQQDSTVPLLSRSEPSRLETLLDKIQNRCQPPLHSIPEFDDTQARKWLEENYDALDEVPGYEIFSLRCKVSPHESRFAHQLLTFDF